MAQVEFLPMRTFQAKNKKGCLLRVDLIPGGTGQIRKSLWDFLTPLGQPKGCPNRLERRFVEQGSHPYGRSERKIKKATS